LVIQTISPEPAGRLVGVKVRHPQQPNSSAEVDGAAVEGAAEAAAVLEAETPEEPGSGCTVHEGLRSLVQLLPRITRGLRRPIADAATRDGTPLGPRHGSALVLLREQDSTVGALASALQLNLATASGLVADLEGVGFVERSNDPQDRRRTIVRIPCESKKLVDAWLDGTTAPIARALEHLSPEERTVLVKAMGYLDAELNGSLPSK
jgi:DNA-binding MarR family transcriptional regulator